MPVLIRYELQRDTGHIREDPEGADRGYPSGWRLGVAAAGATPCSARSALAAALAVAAGWVAAEYPPCTLGDGGAQREIALRKVNLQSAHWQALKITKRFGWVAGTLVVGNHGAVYKQYTIPSGAGLMQGTGLSERLDGRVRQ